MDKKRIEIIITIGLILIFIFAWANSIKLLQGRARQKATGPVPIGPDKEVYAKKEQANAQEENLIWVRDPFSGKIYAAGEGIQGLKLEGIIWDEKTPLAMINEQVVKIGDKLAGSTVVNIKPDRVILNDGTKDIELKL